MALKIIEGDITRQTADAIVNAANSDLAHGGGLAAAIAKAAGPDLLADSAKAPRIKPGSAWATPAGQLNAACVIHAVGPIWTGGQSGEAKTLADAYASAISLAASLGCRSIALPALSIGIFGYPVDLAAPVALEAISGALAEHPEVSEATLCLFGNQTLAAFQAAQERSDLP